MQPSRTSLLAQLIALMMLLAVPLAAPAAETHKLALQVSDNDPEKMKAALTIADSVTFYHRHKGEKVEISIVTFDGGMHMLRIDTSPVQAEIAKFKTTMPHVTFVACAKTMADMQKREGKFIAAVDNATIETYGALSLMELSKKGYTIIKP